MTSEQPVLEQRRAAAVDRNGLSMLDRAECLELLASRNFGRIGLSSAALPVILPVNYHFDGERILILTGTGTKLSAASRDAVVAFEVDDQDPATETGWSVLVTGIARHITDEAELARISHLPLTRWAPLGGGHVIAIEPELVSGRRIDRG